MIVGCGAIAGGKPPTAGFGSRLPLTHAEAYSASQSYAMVACVDPDAGQRRRFQELWSIEQGFDSLSAAIATVGPLDVVSICSPNSQHYAQAVDAIEAGSRAIILEKPPARTLAEAEKLGALAAARGTKVAVNFPRRYAPEIQVLRRELCDGVWGQVRSAVGFYNKGLCHNGIHHLDLVHFLLGGMSLVSAQNARSDAWSDDRTLDVVLQLDNGERFHLIGTDARDYATFDLVLNCERGRVSIEDLGFRVVRRRASDSRDYPGYRVLQAAEDSDSGLSHAMVHMLADVSSALSGSGTLRSSIETSVHAMRLIEAANASSSASTGGEAAHG